MRKLLRRSSGRRCLTLLLTAWLAFAGTRTASAVTALAARNTAFKLQSEAMRLYKDGDFKKAIDLLRQVTNLSLNSFLAYYYLGISLSADRQYSAALEPLKTALELEPGHIQAHIALGDAYLKLGDLSESRAEYLRALTLQDNYAPAHEGLGRVLEAEGDDDRAMDEYSKALELNVAFPDAYASLGELYLRRGRLDDAIDLFRKAIEIKPDFSLGYSRLGIAFSREGLYHQAIAAIGRAKTIAPQDPLPYLSLGRIFLDLGNLQRAESEIEAALVRDPAGYEGPLLKARLLLAEQDLAGAVEVVEKALASEIREAFGRQELEKARDRYKAMSGRLSELTAALGKNPDDPRLYLDLATVLSEAGAQDRAAELAERASQLAPDDATRLRLGYYLLLGRRYSSALPLFQDLASRGSAPAQIDLGLTQSALGRDEEAVATYRKYLEAHPKDPFAHLYLGNSLMRLARPGQAEASYRAYLDLVAGDEKTGKVRRLVRLLQEAEAK
ncbi:MAG TPA: tetratricopeptide repeat protein [Candidatus Polarisedimenticolia bacterium]|jgi:tetratricopeptide (TPR) repeat protein|nr:tetratricopeptide repeat protein [Candidatus Polarisedimenticolia bacterium]